MKLLFHHSKEKNFGDELNRTIWETLIPNFFDNDDSIYFLGIGTILKKPEVNFEKMVVFSSGCGYGEKPVIDNRYKVLCVRGKYTCKELGLNENLGIGDGAILLKGIETQTIEKKYKISYIPHILSEFLYDWRSIAEEIGFNYISPSSKVEDVIYQIKASEMVITEAMHGAIFSDTFRVPWIPVRSNWNVIPFKWLDWLSVLDTEFNPIGLPVLNNPIIIKNKIVNQLHRFKIKHEKLANSIASYSAYPIDFYTRSINRKKVVRLLNDAANYREPSLSKDYALDNVYANLMEKLDEFKGEYVINL